ncbi:MAG: DUF115 domain-containing protein [Treponema sp.]|nr:DUF115 domain-containing protein [Treponema sp.]
MCRLYGSTMRAKSGTQIPVFLSGRTIESRYNPENDAERLLSTIESAKKFFLVLGIGSGLFIKKLLENNPYCFVLGVENCDENIDFLLQLDSVKSLQKNERCYFCSINQIEQTLPNLYVPAFYGDMQIIEQRAWINEIGNQFTQVQQKIQNAISFISADYSVQTHFGKIWQANIKNNIINTEYEKVFPAPKIDTTKKAVIIAAGPTLDEKIQKLKLERNSSFIIATDTAFSTLLRNNLKPDAVISIDGQHISQTHFIHKTDFSDTIFIFDLTSNANAVRYVQNQGGKVYFCKNGHPLSKIAANFTNEPDKIPNLYTGSGTVTIAATDFAIKAGFTKIEVIGADFSYKNNKPYAKGTYLDSIYFKESNRLNTFEQKFSKLMYRTELEKIAENTFTTKVLESYKISFEKYLEDCNLKFTKEDDIYKIENNLPQKNELADLRPAHVNSTKFVDYINQNYSNSKKTFSALNEVELALLPAAAFYRRTKPEFGNNANEFLKLAYYSLVGYN